jgi:DNA-binding NarL/FixJ family response regulator
MIRVLVVEEVRAIGEIIATVLRSAANLTVVNCATSLDEAVPYLSACDVVVVNACLTTEASVALVRGLRRLAPRVKIVVMGLARSQPALRQCAEANVSGYVLKDSPAEELLRCLYAAARRDTVGAPPLAATLFASVAELGGLDDTGALDRCGPRILTRREREVLSLVQQGLTNQEIAASLVIELGTVKNHVHNILRKLNVNSRRDAVHASRLAGAWSVGDRPLLGGQRPLETQPERPSLFSAALAATN